MARRCPLESVAGAGTIPAEVFMHIDRRLVVGPAALAGAALAAVLASAQSPAFTTITGEIGPGSLYEIAMPTAPWNGELVLFAHGIGNPAEPVALPAIGPLKDTLAANGFAIAYSSFSVNGYGGLKDGMQRTHQLRGVFTATAGEPTRVYLVGRSLGGLVVAGLVERFPGQYDGALANCGLLGGGAAELQYLGDARVLFDYFFPGIVPLGPDLGALPGIDFSQGGSTFTAARNALIQGLSSPGQPTLQFARTAGLPAAGPTEILTTALTVIGFTVLQGTDLMEVTHSHMPYDNIATVYKGSSDDVALNAGVARFAADPSAALRAAGC